MEDAVGNGGRGEEKRQMVLPTSPDFFAQRSNRSFLLPRLLSFMMLDFVFNFYIC